MSEFLLLIVLVIWLAAAQLTAWRFLVVTVRLTTKKESALDFVLPSVVLLITMLGGPIGLMAVIMADYSIDTFPKDNRS